MVPPLTETWLSDLTLAVFSFLSFVCVWGRAFAALAFSGIRQAPDLIAMVVRLSPACLSGDSLPATTLPLIGPLGCIMLLWILHCACHLGLRAHSDAACRFGLRAHFDAAPGMGPLPASIVSSCTSLGFLMGRVLIALLPFQLCSDVCSWLDSRGDHYATTTVYLI